MDRAALRRKTRRLINQVTAGGFFEDPDVEDEINNAYHFAQGRIRLLAPHEFLRRARANIVAGQVRYARPTYEQVRALRLKDSATGAYKDMDRGDIEQTVDDVAGVRNTQGRSGTIYAFEGSEIILSPTPQQNVTDGLEALYFEPLSLSADSDTPRLPLKLHELIAHGAALRCLADSKTLEAELLAQVATPWLAVFGETREALAELWKHYKPEAPVLFTPGISWATR